MYLHGNFKETGQFLEQQQLHKEIQDASFGRGSGSKIIIWDGKRKHDGGFIQETGHIPAERTEEDFRNENNIRI